MTLHSEEPLRVLIVSSDENIRRQWAEKLNDKEIEISFCQSLRNAYFTLFSIPVHLILTRKHQIDQEGTDFINRLRVAGIRVPVVVLLEGESPCSNYPEHLLITFMSEADWGGGPKMKSILLDRLTEVVNETRRRRYSRHHCNLDVFYESVRSGQESVSKVISLSMGGMFLATSFELPQIGDFVSFRIAPSEVNASEVEGIGVVRWVRERSNTNQPSGFAIEFMGLSGESQALVDAMITRLSAPSTELTHTPS